MTKTVSADGKENKKRSRLCVCGKKERKKKKKKKLLFNGAEEGEALEDCICLTDLFVC